MTKIWNTFDGVLVVPRPPLTDVLEIVRRRHPRRSDKNLEHPAEKCSNSAGDLVTFPNKIQRGGGESFRTPHQSVPNICHTAVHDFLQKPAIFAPPSYFRIAGGSVWWESTFPNCFASRPSPARAPCWGQGGRQWWRNSTAASAARLCLPRTPSPVYSRMPPRIECA